MDNIRLPKETEANSSESYQTSYLSCPFLLEGKLEEIASRRSTPGIAFVNQRLKVIFSNKEAKLIFNQISTFRLYQGKKSENPRKKLNEVWSSFFPSDSTKQNDFVEPFILMGRQKKTIEPYYLIKFIPLREREGLLGQPEPLLFILIETIYKANSLFTVKLTKREQGLVNLLAQGNSYNKIAEKLYISIHTVHAHIRNIKKKLNVNNKLSILNAVLKKQ